MKTSLALACLSLSLVVVHAANPGLPPLNTLGTGVYQGFTGGLYAEGKNDPWGTHAEALRKVSDAIQPLNTEGKPDPQGKIIIAGIGASVCAQIFDAMETVGPQTESLNPAVVFVNCAKGGQDIHKIADESGRYWTQAKASLEKRQFTPAQVQVVWYQSDDLRDTRADFPGRPQRFKDELAKQLVLLKQQYPNLRLCYFSARHTTAFINEGANAGEKHGEPRPYQNGWAIKWLIEEQAGGRKDVRFEGADAPAPLAAWATYFWTNGDEKRADGYQWTRTESLKDGVHLVPEARTRVAKELTAFWRTDPYAKTWFTAAGATAAKTAAPSTTAAKPVIRKDAGPNEPAWIINGANKMPKLERLLGSTEGIRVVVLNLEGKQVLEIHNVFTHHTDLNQAIGPGEYRVRFYDRTGMPLKLTQEVAEVLRLK